MYRDRQWKVHCRIDFKEEKMQKSAVFKLKWNF